MVYGNKGPGYHPYLNKQCATIAEVLREADYRTMMPGKWHGGHQQVSLSARRDPLQFGFVDLTLSITHPTPALPTPIPYSLS